MIIIAFAVTAGLVRALLHKEEKHDREIPFYSTSTPAVAKAAMVIIKQSGCRDCHSLWTLSSVLQSVPAPMLDGIGALRNEAWLYEYLSSSDPQTILPSRLKQQYRMPSYATLSDEERHTVAGYLASLQVKDWYLEQTKKAAYEKLTGKEYQK